MGEYAMYNGSHIKIGTCEDMMYLRPDQIDKVRPEAPFTADVIAACRFRFPFPDEDKNEPGDFDDSDRGFAVWDFEIPAGVDHSKIQFKAGAGILASLPCPYSTDGIVFSKANKIPYHFNGFGGPAKIMQQRVWAGVWATVLACGCCGARFRLPTIDDAAPLLVALERMAVQATGRDQSGYAATIREIARRVRVGYETPAPAVSVD